MQLVSLPTSIPLQSTPALHYSPIAPLIVFQTIAAVAVILTCLNCPNSFFLEDLHFTANRFFLLNLKQILPNTGHNSLSGSYRNIQNLPVYLLLSVDVFALSLTLI